MELNMSIARYAPYGHALPIPDSLLGFNGECVLKPLEHYFLGAGHRLYSPSLMRFFSADIKSPFEEGGLNAYAYCAGDPVNRIDPTGQSWLSLFKGIGNRLGLRSRPPQQQPRPSPMPLAQPTRTTRESVIASAASEPPPPSYRETLHKFSESRQNKIRAINTKIERLEVELDIAQRMYDPTEPFLARRLERQIRNRDRLWGRPQLPADDELFHRRIEPSQTTINSNVRRVRFAV
ncbi:RHS repeat-associated core domain-containing protein [Pseudomonas putida]|uniref:RHS repeat-associated core domain-containing protein n=2 Tax=Pseudomonas putida TaxID=303 RepID=UPI000DB73E6D|nr:RHS repeat-associated core domain-containing protein [Pseudomonas putida]MBI6959965.1 RHS repeat-associated core domain-containing protein [Pseudomonas putida]PZQ36152.1 MAG: hypothetical protein DI560_25610 [Pseudomonas putida]